MYPNLFGLEGFSMTFMILLGVLVASLIFIIYLKKRAHINSLDMILVILVTVGIGIIFAILFENIYEAIKASINGKSPSWTWGMTFFGGLFGGIVTFLLMYKYYYLKHNAPCLKEILIIAPGAICFGHAFGRIGCFLSGCCYGIEIENGILFPGHTSPVLPTQLIEMGFLFVLGTILIILPIKRISVYTMPIYLASYSVFRFIIEFFRGDERGQLAGLSPSQYWCIILLLLSIALIFIYRKINFASGEKYDNEVQ